MKAFNEKFNELPGLIKVDINSAFRRIPIKGSDLWACGIVFLFLGQVGVMCFMTYVKLHVVQVYVSQHFACPFGAVGSVHAWERIGAAICHIAGVYLKLPLWRYVDDYFGTER